MQEISSSSPAPGRLTLLVGCFVTALCALLATVGADADWLAALGRDIAQSGSIPHGVPFAAVSSAGWHNVPVIGELVFHGLQAGLGPRGLALAQVAAVAFCLWLLAADMRRGGIADTPAALVMMLTAFAAAPALLAVRSQLFSLALFPLVLLLVRDEARRPSRRIWLLVPLVAVWSNLHGGVLIGIAVAAAYLLLTRLRRDPLVAVGVLGGMAVALFATPALLSTGAYYRGVMGSVAATHGEGMWAPLSLSSPFDLVFLATAVPLVVLALRSRPALWETVVIVALAVVAVRAGRNEVWLALFLATPAARGLAGSRTWSVPVPRLLAVPVIAALAALAGAGLAKSTTFVGATPELMDTAARYAGPLPILADGPDAERLALAGHRILIGNPLDAFPKREQQLYLDWLAGRPNGDVEANRVCSILVRKGSAPDRRLVHRPAFAPVEYEPHVVLWWRKACIELT